MTREDFCAKYGHVEVTFSSYYKYSFTYAADLPDGKRITVECGGNADDIYRHEVSLRAETINDLQPYAGTVRKGHEVIDSFYDY